jgi:hypothetical protein
MPTTPIYALRYPALTDPADVPTDMGELATDVEGALTGALPVKPVVNGKFVKGVGGAAVWSSLATDALSATPPASPVDGQLWSMAADAPNGIVWTFRYNAGSPSAYKWEFVGGAPLVLAAAGIFTHTVASWQATGVLFTVVRAGDYFATQNALLGNNSAGAGEFGALPLVNGVVQQPAYSGDFSNVPVGSKVTLHSEQPLPGIAASATIGEGFYATRIDGSKGAFEQRIFTVVPRRVS